MNVKKWLSVRPQPIEVDAILLVMRFFVDHKIFGTSIR